MNETAPISLFGMSIDPLDLRQAVDTVWSWCVDESPQRCRYVVTPNVDHAVMFQQSRPLQAAYQDASLVLADGSPVVAAARLLGRRLPERVAGSDLGPGLLEASSRNSLDGPPLRVFLLGAGPGVAEQAKKRIHEQYDRVEVVGTLSPPLGFQDQPEENQRILAAISAAHPDVVFVGLGAPKQELWVHRFADQIDAKAALCIGATIDFLAGEKSRAPRWMQRTGLEWLHRLASEPKRLAKRYLKDAWIFPQLVWHEWRTMRRRHSALAKAN